MFCLLLCYRSIFSCIINSISCSLDSINRSIVSCNSSTNSSNSSIVSSNGNIYVSILFCTIICNILSHIGWSSSCCALISLQHDVPSCAISNISFLRFYQSSLQLFSFDTSPSFTILVCCEFVQFSNPLVQVLSYLQCTCSSFIFFIVSQFFQVSQIIFFFIRSFCINECRVTFFICSDHSLQISALVDEFHQRSIDSV